MRRLNRPATALFWLLAVALTLCLASLPMLAQSASSGTLAGIVNDPSGAVIPGAQVTLISTATGTTYNTTTTSAGRYIFTSVPPGTYDISVKASGFSNVKIPGQVVKVGTQTNVNIPMQLGNVSQTVEVQTTGTELQTMNATVGNTVTGIALNSLPSLGRDVSTFATLQPGVSPDGSVAGTVVDNSSFQLDGGNNTNDMDGSMSVYTPTFAGDPTGGIGLGSQPTGVIPTPADSVEEFKVNTANQTADFNSSSGMQVQVVTKRGTNAFHGTVYEYYFDNNFNANTWFNNNTSTPNPSYHRSRFGVAMGGPVLPSFLGGKTYMFGNYQGYRFPNSVTYERIVPSAAMRAGFITDPKTGAQYPVLASDPLGIGMNSIISKLWATLPAGNDQQCTFSTRCDNKGLGGNIEGFKGNMALPQNDNYGVVRLDHDFGSKWHFMSTYHYYKLTRAATSQVDIGGFFGDKPGVPTSLSTRPQQPWSFAAGMTTNISPTVTNDFHYNYLRNYWSWADKEDTPQYSGLGGALEPFGESSTSALVPYNLNTQSVRTRFWDGHDTMLRDDVSWLRGNHLFNFGGTYQRNYDWHQRSDNGGGINYQPVYQLNSASGSRISGIPVPAGYTGSVSNWNRDYAAMLGMITIAQTAYTRTGANLTLNPPNTHAFDQSTIPFYNIYASDTWHMKPSLTLTYGLGWTLELPPTEKNGKQVSVVDVNGKPLDTLAYLAARKSAALQGQVYNPNIAFALLPNVAGHPKYPYNPYYKEFSPRVALSWSPQTSGDGILGKLMGNNGTVIRGGYGRIFGRLNGVDLVLVPLLGDGLIQAVQCIDPTTSGTCAGDLGATPTTAFRIGTNGMTAPLGPAPANTLPNILIPGVNVQAAGAAEGLDANFRPNVTDTFTFSVQRQLGPKASLEVGYIGRRITHEYQPLNINAVPTMMTMGGQTFAKAYAAVETQLGCDKGPANCGANVPATFTAQPFFEAAINPAYCAGFANCTTAVANNELGNFTTQSVWSLYSDLDNGAFNFARSMLNTPIPGAAPCPGSPDPTPCGANGQLSSGVGMNASVGYGNYNAGFVTLKTSGWHSLTTQQNFTWSKSLGTGAVVQASSEYTADDPYNLGLMYGLQPWDRKFVYNLYIVWDDPFYKNQSGFIGHALGGWRMSPVFTAGSGEPMPIYPTNSGGGYYGGQGFGEGDSNNFFSNDQGVQIGNPGSGGSLHYSKCPTATSPNAHCLNYYANPTQAYAAFRDPILGIDTHRDGGLGIVRGFPYWNMDIALGKTIHVTERMSFELQGVFTNVLNHFQPADPNGYFTTTGNLDLTSDPSSFGQVGDQINAPRQMEFGIRFNW